MDIITSVKPFFFLYKFVLTRKQGYPLCGGYPFSFFWERKNVVNKNYKYIENGIVVEVFSKCED